MSIIDLSGKWKLRAEFLDIEIENYAQVLSRPEGKLEFFKRAQNCGAFKKGWIDANVPCDIIQPLVENNLLEEPFNKTNTLDCLWLKDLSWWFVKEFEIDEDFSLEEKIFLQFNMLDFKADFVLNGNILGRHANTFVPFVKEVKRFIKTGTNILIIRLTSGVEDFYTQTNVSHFAASPFAIMDKRVFLRKPQFSYGWDWCKPVPTCGIGRGCFIESVSGAKISYLHSYTKEVSVSEAIIKIDVEIDNLCDYSSDDVELNVKINFDGENIISKKEFLRVVGGLSYHSYEICIKNPKLWMPNGYGEQNLYDVSAFVVCRNKTNHYKNYKLGIRKIELDESKLLDDTYLYAFKVNGIKIYCKGGNWVPADSVYLRIPDQTYVTLIEEAKEQNFTMLRMWGGGLYEPDIFYETCDKNGILIMHDFMYACSYYPDHLDWFLHEAEKEAQYQTRRLSNFACMAIWTGNNEIQESFTDWFPENENIEYFAGSKIFNYIQPKAVHNNCPEIPYKPSSPFGGSVANSQEEGDSHVWKWMRILSEKTPDIVHNIDNFAELTTRFSSEYGFHGPMMKKSIEKFHCGEKLDLNSALWLHHGEQQNKTKNIKKSINQYFTDSDKLDVDEYLLYGGVNQGMLYREMGDALRKKNYCYGHLIWMYNDCWPETGWTTVDYYLNRKISFYFLKRAFETQKILLDVNNNNISVIFHNETPTEKSLNLEYGFTMFDGKNIFKNELSLIMPKHERKQIFNFECKEDLTKGFAYVIEKTNTEINPATTINGHYRNYCFEKPIVEIISIEQNKNDLIVKIIAKNYVPIVYISSDIENMKLSDNYFECLPNLQKTITIFNCDDKNICLNFVKIDSI